MWHLCTVTGDLFKLLTSPATAAVVVAMAGTILPAMSLVLNLSTGSISYMVALRFCEPGNGMCSMIMNTTGNPYHV